MFARIRKIIELTMLSLKDKVGSEVRSENLAEKKQGETVLKPNVDENLEDKSAGPSGPTEMQMKEKIVMIHILRNWMMTPRWTKILEQHHKIVEMFIV